MLALKVVNLTKWHQFFMHLSYYWSWISSDHNIVKVAVEPRGDSRVDLQTTLIITGQDSLKTDVNLFFTIANCQIVLSFVDASHKFSNSCVCPFIDNKNWPTSVWEFLKKRYLMGKFCNFLWRKCHTPRTTWWGGGGGGGTFLVPTFQLTTYTITFVMK